MHRFCVKTGPKLIQDSIPDNGFQFTHIERIETRYFTWAAARRQAGEAQTIGACSTYVLGHRAARTIMMMNKTTISASKIMRMRRPRGVTPSMPPAF